MRMRTSQRRSGQLSIDYIAGALVFFGAILVLMGSVLNTIPRFQNTHTTNELELSSWGVSDVIMQDTGYWNNSGGNGTDWQTVNPTDVAVIGLQTADRSGISMAKLEALQNMKYKTLKQILGTKKDFSISFTEFLYTDLHSTFQKGGPSPVKSGGTGASPGATNRAAQYLLDHQGSDQVIIDSAQRNDGTRGASTSIEPQDPEWSRGKHGDSLTFDGNDYARAPYASQLSVDTVTVGAWVKPLTNTGEMVIASKDGAYKMGIQNGKFVAAIAADSCTEGTGYWCDDGSFGRSGWVSSTFDVPVNTWTHVAFSWNTTHYQFYRNGKLVRSIRPSEISGSAVIRDTTTGLGIGADHTGSTPDSQFQGSIDEVTIYNESVIPAVNTEQTGEATAIPQLITEPSYPPHTAPTIHYGVKKINDIPYYFLLADSAGWYNNLWISNDWDFTDGRTTYYNLTQDHVLTFGGAAYTVNLANMQLGHGNVLILQKRIGRAGTVPPTNTANILETKRYGVPAGTQHNIIRAVFQLW